MKKSILLVLILAVICSVFNTVLAMSVHQNDESAGYDPKIQPGEMNIYTVGNAFEWGTPYEIVSSFLNQISNLRWYDDSADLIYVSIQEANEHYYFYFQNNKLYKIRLIHTGESNADVPGLMNEFIAEYNISDLDAFAESDELNLYAGKNPGAMLVADENTAYCAFFHEEKENSKYIPYASFILLDRSYTDQNSNSNAEEGKEENAEEGKEEQTKLNLVPNISPDGFGKETFGYAFDWGTDYDTVLNFLSQLSGYQMEKDNSYISIQTKNVYNAPEIYKFEFSNGKLSAISGSIYTMYMGSSALQSLASITESLKKIYGLENLEPYTKNAKMNAKTHNTDTSFIAADDYTIYGLFNNLTSGDYLSSVDFIFADKYKSETGISSADAGIKRPWEEVSEASSADSTEAVESSIDKSETAASTPSGETMLIGNCKYGSYLMNGDKAEVVNVSALQMYQSPNNYPIEGLYAFPGKEITITGGPNCVDGIVWWEIIFLGYTGWAAEMNADGVYYLEKR